MSNNQPQDSDAWLNRPASWDFYITTDWEDGELSSPVAYRNCSYCGTKCKHGERCESCGAPDRSLNDTLVTTVNK